MNKYIIAAFDFDGTLTRKDTLNDLIIYKFGYLKFIIGFIRVLPLIMLYLLGFLPNHIPKLKLFSHFFSGFSEKRFREICRHYSLKRVERIIRKDCLKKVKWHKQQGHKIVIISASVDEWIRPWADKNSFDEVISTGVEIEDGYLTGKFSSINCFGKEKVRRLLEKFPDRGKYFLYAYGDSRGDKELLEFADAGLFRRVGSLDYEK